MKFSKLIATSAVLALFGFAASAQADTLTFDNGGAGWLFDENNPVSIAFDFPANPGGLVEIKSITVDMSHTWSGDVDMTLIGPAGSFSHLMDNAGGSTDLGGAYTFVPSGGAAAGTYAAGGPGTYDAFVWSAGLFPLVGWFIDFTDSAGGDAGFINSVSIEYNPVPVPAAIWLMITALGGLGFMRRR